MPSLLDTDWEGRRMSEYGLYLMQLHMVLVLWLQQWALDAHFLESEPILMQENTQRYTKLSDIFIYVYLWFALDTRNFIHRRHYRWRLLLCNDVCWNVKRWFVPPKLVDLSFVHNSISPGYCYWTCYWHYCGMFFNSYLIHSTLFLPYILLY